MYLVVPSASIREGLVAQCEICVSGSPVLTELFVGEVVELVETKCNLQVLLLRWEGHSGWT